MNDDPGGADVFARIRISLRWWELGGDPGTCELTAVAWRALGDQAAGCADRLTSGTRGLLAGEWTGEARDSFAGHLRRLLGDLDDARTEAYHTAEQVDGLASVLSTYQEALDSARLAIMRRVLSHREGSLFDGDIVFSPRDQHDVDAVKAAVDEAGAIREEFDRALVDYANRFSSAVWSEIRARWTDVVTGAAYPFTVPGEATGTRVVVVDGAVVISTGPGADRVSVDINPVTGEILVRVNGAWHVWPAGTPITVRTAGGGDVITVAKHVDVDLVLLGGDGHDRIRAGGGRDTVLGGYGGDDLLGGDGDDYLTGGHGVDYVDGQGGGDRLSGGHGNDHLYGLGDADYLSGGEGRDYLEGGKGDDIVDGGAGTDVVSGGRGDDGLRGGAGNDVLYAGRGNDTIDGGGGMADTAYRQTGDRVENAAGVRVEVTSDGGFIRITGSPEFVERVTADLDMLRASPTGQQMLAELDDIRDPDPLPGARELFIGELGAENGAAIPQDAVNAIGSIYDLPGIPNPANPGAVILYNPSHTFDSTGGTPVVVLYHEMAHVRSYFNGNADFLPIEAGKPDAGTMRIERQAVGLPYLDHDGDPRTPDRTDAEQPPQFTENGLRQELGLPRRSSYQG